MNFNVHQDGGVPIKLWTKGVEVADNAVQQLVNTSRMPFVFKHVAAMPDVHWGMGATVGSVVATKGAIIPAAVGVDIGCGMMAAKLTINAGRLPDNLAGVRAAIERAIPHGRTDNGGRNDRGAWGDIPDDVAAAYKRDLMDDYTKIVEKNPKCRTQNDAPERHLCTLGTGNHFIELCLDENDNVWLMLHTGSRGAGNRIGSYFIECAKRDMERWFISLPDKDLAYLPEGSEFFKDYCNAVRWAQRYAEISRQLMMSKAINAIADELNSSITWDGTEHPVVACHHNYVSWEQHYGESVIVTRKGAVRAGAGDMGVIPGSMGTRSYIVRGLGNKESFCSCSHGAGRVMSRGEAKRSVSLEEHAKATAHVECRKDEGVLDETPAAYKNIDAVMEAQKDLVEIVHTLRQVVCVKG